ncbi:MAG: hypothetical protein ACOCTT_00100 [archaeon]
MKKKCSMRNNNREEYEDKGKKGFSLFTPLVGTAVIIIAILVSITMIQNNLKISEGISDSYSASGQSIGSQTIQSASTGFIIDQIEKYTKKQLEGGRGDYITIEECEDGDECNSELKEELNEWGALKRELQIRWFIGMLDRVRTVTDYEIVGGDDCEKACEKLDDQGVDVPTRCYDTFEDCADAVSVQGIGIDIVSTEYTDEGSLEVRLNTNKIRESEHYRDAFEIRLKDEGEETDMTIIMVPSEATYTTAKLSDHISKTGEAFDYLKENAEDKDLDIICNEIKADILDNEYEYDELTLINGTEGEVALQIKWKNIDIDTNLHLEYKSAEYVEGQEESC